MYYNLISHAENLHFSEMYVHYKNVFLLELFNSSYLYLFSVALKKLSCFISDFVLELAQPKCYYPRFWYH